MSRFINECMEALERLKQNKPLIIQKGSRINLDTVALEAGKNRSSIRKDRYPELYAIIQEAEQNDLTPRQQDAVKLEKIKFERDRYKKLYEEAIGRELMLVDRLSELEKKNKQNVLKFPSANNV